MAVYELRRIYGNKKGKQLVNAAIRAEIPGGAEVLDALHVLISERPTCSTCGCAVKRLYELLNAAQSRMADMIADKYAFKSAQSKQEDNHVASTKD